MTARAVRVAHYAIAMLKLSQQIESSWQEDEAVLELRLDLLLFFQSLKLCVVIAFTPA